MASSTVDVSSVKGGNLQPGHAGYIWGLSLASIILATVVLFLRLWSRLLNRTQRFGPDDWMAAAAWPFLIGQGLLIMFCMRWGVGVHSDQLTGQEYSVYNKLLLAVLIAYYFNMDFIRISLSLYYRRIFASSPIFKRFVWANIALNVIWHILITFGAIFQCSNPSAMWDKSVQAHCDPPIQHQHFCSSSSMVMDILALLLPIPMIWRLHLKSSKKWEVLTIFFVGYCVPVMTIGRLIATLKTNNALNTDPSWNWPSIVVWLVLETMTAYLGVCMPSLMFLGRRWQTSGVTAIFNRHTSPRSALDSEPNLPLDLKSMPKGSGASVAVSELRSPDGNASPAAICQQPLMSIVQTRTFTVTREGDDI